MSPFDRYANMKPIAFASVEEYNMFMKHATSGDKDRLIREANDAIAWGRPDKESTGYSSGDFIDFIDLIKRLKNYIEAS